MEEEVSQRRQSLGRTTELEAKNITLREAKVRQTIHMGDITVLSVVDPE